MNEVEHIIVLMFENRSFDHMLGLLDHPDVAFPKITPGDSELSNRLDDETEVPVWRGQDDYFVPTGPGHKHEDVMHQMYGVKHPASEHSEPTMKGFAANHHLRDSSRYRDVMRSYQGDRAPVLHALAKQFCVCTNWFSSVPGPTWPNRLFAMTGQSGGLVSNQVSKAPLAIRSVFDAVEEHGDWRIYHDGPTLTLLLDDIRSKGRKKKFRKLKHLKKDIINDKLPAFSWVEPDHLGKDSSSQHANHVDEDSNEWDFLSAENLMCDIYDWLRANQKVFEKTAFIITYDEHGGFHDHVPPGKAARPHESHVYRKHGYVFEFERLGPRVPAVIISPRIAPGTIDATRYDHAAIVRAVADQFVPAGAGLLTDRVKDNPSPLANLGSVVNPVEKMPKIERRIINDKPADWRLKLAGFGDSLIQSLAALLFKLMSTNRGAHDVNLAHAESLTGNEALDAHLHTLEVYAQGASPALPAPESSSERTPGPDEIGLAAAAPDIVEAAHAVMDALLEPDLTPASDPTRK